MREDAGIEILLSTPKLHEHSLFSCTARVKIPAVLEYEAKRSTNLICNASKVASNEYVGCAELLHERLSSPLKSGAAATPT
jgi:hypothetical protein